MDDRPAVVHAVNRLDGGGMERQLLALLRAMDRRNFRHVLVTLRDPGPLAGRTPDDVTLHSLGRVGVSRMAGLALGRLLRREAAAIIHARGVCCWADAIVAKALHGRSQLVLGFHGFETRAESGTAMPGGLRAKARLGLWMGARFASVSNSGVAQLEAAKVPVSRITVIPNGVDRTVFRPVDAQRRRMARTALGVTPDAFVVGAVSSLTPIKRVDLLIEALALLKTKDVGGRLSALIVGDGPLRHSLTAEADRQGLGESVRFLGARDDVPDILSALDVFVSTSDSEGMCNSLLEAMAVGVSVVATPVGDNGMMVRDGVDGFLCDPGAATQVADTLLRLFSAPPLRERMAGAAASRAAAFDFGHTIARYDDFYQSVASTLQQHKRSARRHRAALLDGDNCALPAPDAR